MHSTHEWGWAFAAEARGELPHGTADRWARASAPFAILPAHAAGFSAHGSIDTYPPAAFVGFPTGLPSAWPPTPDPAPVPTEPPAVKPRRQMSALAAAGVTLAGLGVALALALRWAR